MIIWGMDSYRNQQNMPINVLQKEVKMKWNVDVHTSFLYRARRKRQQKIYSKLDDKYHRSCNYFSIVKKTNVGSCLILIIERLLFQVPCKFQRLYVSLVAMKNCFKEWCRPVISVDACFLKMMFKGQLMATVEGDANNNMYPIAMTVVEANNKDG
jgi:hypothetical protein